jgi:hypothetical protein
VYLRGRHRKSESGPQRDSCRPVARLHHPPWLGGTDAQALAAAGIAVTDELRRGCPDVEVQPDTLEDSDVVVVPTGEDADFLISWPEAEGKQVFALSDFLGEDGWAVVDPGSPILEYVSQVREGIPLLLRALVAESR